MKSLQIGKIKLKNPLFLAPMVDITDKAYREICRENGAAIAYTEMIVVDSLLHKNAHTLSKIKITKKDRPLGIQITGDNISKFEKAIPILKKFDIVDINCGCPSNRIQNNKAGSFLLKDPNKIADIIRMLKSHNLTVTAKIRLGFDDNNVLNIAKEIENAGADAITIHARLANQGYETPADWSQITKIKNKIKIPVIGNGDILTPEKAVYMLKICDGAMIARGAIGNPMIFKQTLDLINKGKYENEIFKKNIKLLIKYIKLVKKYDIIEIPRIKYLATKFIKNIPGSAKLRQEIMSLKTYTELEEYIKKL